MTKLNSLRKHTVHVFEGMQPPVTVLASLEQEIQEAQQDFYDRKSPHDQLQAIRRGIFERQAVIGDVSSRIRYYQDKIGHKVKKIQDLRRMESMIMLRAGIRPWTDVARIEE
eukprot:10436363-Karenia_brevis.AAC.1